MSDILEELLNLKTLIGAKFYKQLTLNIEEDDLCKIPASNIGNVEIVFGCYFPLNDGRFHFQLSLASM